MISTSFCWYYLTLGYVQPNILVEVVSSNGLNKMRTLLKNHEMTINELIAELNRLEINKEFMIYVSTGYLKEFNQLKEAGFNCIDDRELSQEQIKLLKFII